jgi:predicted phage terminase large subunit-like protein
MKSIDSLIKEHQTKSKKEKKKEKVVFADVSQDPNQDFSLDEQRTNFNPNDFFPDLEIEVKELSYVPVSKKEAVSQGQKNVFEKTVNVEAEVKKQKLIAELNAVKKKEKVQEEVVKRIQKELISESLEAFLLYDNQDYDVQPFHKIIIEKFEEAVTVGGKRIIISMPPRHGKSEIISKKGIAWAMSKNPDKEIVLVTYGQTLSDDFSRIARATLIEHQDMLGVEISKDSASVSKWGIEGRKGSVTAAGALGAITGRGANLLVIDDVVKSTVDAGNPSAMEKLWNNYRAVFRTRLAPNASIIVVATRWSEDDLIGRLLAEAEKNESADQWEYICFPAECVSPSEDYLGRKKGEFLWESRFSQSEYNGFKMALGSNLWSSLYQQMPMALGGNIIRTEWIKYYENRQLDFKDMRTFISVDTAFKGGENSDFTVIQLWGVQDTKYYLLNQVRDKYSFTECLTMLDIFIEDSAKIKRPSGILIEDKANGTAIINVLKRKYANIIAINPEGNKQNRLVAVAPLFEAGSVYLPRNAEYLPIYLSELTGFPFAKHDDQVDATSQVLNYVSNRFATQQSSINIRGLLRL